MAEDFGVHLDLNQIQRAGAKAIGRREEIVQESAQNSIKYIGDNALFVNIRRNFDTLESTVRKKEVLGKKTEETEEPEALPEVEGIEETAAQFQKKNPELLIKSLLYLRERITSSDSQKDILDKLQEAYPDPYLASDALDFLIETSTGEMREKLVEAKKQFMERYGKEVLAGKNIHLQAREFSKTGLGTPSGLRELYKDVTQNAREPAQLFSELTENYTFEKMTTVIAFMLHSLGSDLKSKGPSISRGELARLLADTKSMQAILGVYRFFKSRMHLIFSS
ncbi:MAG: type III secretion system gatekeeper subunit SctW, partial [Verrucomicrobia bacterium]|nr:type III secretion system gatekeeper subunit SctW [Verrucomicrobiota bacterium]